MNALHLHDERSPRAAIADLIDRHGLVAVAAALAAWLVRRRVRAPRDDEPVPELMSNHLRRDIGLPPLPDRRSRPELW